MATLTIRIPDDKHRRLKALAKHRHVSVNRLIDELSTQALAEFDGEVCFRALSMNGDPARELELLDKIDAHFSEG
ncbi:MAG: toxin-antitoxin system HicB family antitoxin [endosymbiont of Escarpia spicata]|uniref:Toxin-antitoxin system HicB family antitoxin n=1 Tax=endosymbiont of Escarpia spicata TaxID=2200908 RepID=A0A370DQP0_9GAMM|nr:MAG: toxin-antitoxin system HicB family antitoxin [endosymbiont of Escarpia spicata]